MKKRPNILFLMTDEQRYDAVGYVNPQVLTPHLDAMARESVCFLNAYTAIRPHSGQGSYFYGEIPFPVRRAGLYEFPAGKGNHFYEASAGRGLLYGGYR